MLPQRLGVRVKLDLLAVDEIRAATPKAMELSPQLKLPTSSNCLRGRDEVVVEKKLFTDKDRIGDKSDLCDWQDIPTFAARATSTPSSMGPFSCSAA